MRRSTDRILYACLALTGAAWSHEDGPPPAHTGGPGDADCTACHFDAAVNAPGGKVTISGIGETFRPGQQYKLILTVERDDISTAGFQLAVRDAGQASAGNLYSESDDTRVIMDDESGQTYWQHSRPTRAANADHFVTWSALWKAPEHGGPVTVSLAALAANDDASPLGDFVYTMTRSLQPCGQILEAVDETDAADKVRTGEVDIACGECRNAIEPRTLLTTKSETSVNRQADRPAARHDWQVP